MKKKLLITLLSCSSLSFTACGESQISANNILQQFQGANFPVEEIIDYTEENDPNKLLGQPGQYIEKINFSDFNFPYSGFGLEGISIEIFNNEKDCENRRAYLKEIAEEYDYTEYHYYHKNALLRLNGEMPSEYAQQYASAFQNAISGKNIDEYKIAKEDTSTLTIELSDNVSDSSDIKASLESMPEIMSIKLVTAEERWKTFADTYLGGENQDFAEKFSSTISTDCYTAVVSTWNVEELRKEIESIDGVDNISASSNIEDPKIE